MTDFYEVPKSQNILSHLTNARALQDYKRENARKLVQRQEALVRNLSKVREAMEDEETQIGKTKDYYSGSRKEKFEHTLNLADRLRNRRFADKEITKIVKEASEEAKLPVSYGKWTVETKASVAPSYSAPVSKTYPTSLSYHYSQDSGNPVPYQFSNIDLKYTDSYKAGSDNANLSEIEKLKDQVETISKRYKTETEVSSKPYLTNPEYYPGAYYLKDLKEVPVTGADVAQYFPATRYVLY